MILLNQRHKIFIYFVITGYNDFTELSKYNTTHELECFQKVFKGEQNGKQSNQVGLGR